MAQSVLVVEWLTLRKIFELKILVFNAREVLLGQLLERVDGVVTYEAQRHQVGRIVLVIVS